MERIIKWFVPIVVTLALLIASALFLMWFRTVEQDIPAPSDIAMVYIPQSQDMYQTKPYEQLVSQPKGLSTNQLKQHYGLYTGYVNKRNEIEKNLQTVDRQKKANRTYSPYRALKIAETYAVNGSLLHELYFENMKPTDTQPGAEIMKLITCSFGSFDNFKKDFIDAAGVARGWVVTAYGMDDGRVHNYVLEEHNQNVPVLSIPLLVLDVYEHAYMIDFGTKRTPYVDIFWNNIDWNVVEERIKKWVAWFLSTLPMYCIFAYKRFAFCVPPFTLLTLFCYY